MQDEEGKEATNGEAKIRVNITISPDVHEEGKTIAKKDKRTFSNFVEKLIEEEKKRGVIIPVDSAAFSGGASTAATTRRAIKHGAAALGMGKSPESEVGA
jgi:predicted CopG family antitoxin